MQSHSNETQTSKLDAAIAQKIRMRELENQFVDEDCLDYEHRLTQARLKAGSDEGLQSILTWLAILRPLDAHPTYILQAWAGWQCRSNPVAPNFGP